MMKAFLLPLAAASLSLVVLTGSVYTQARGQGRGQSFGLPDGAGKDVVQTQCTKCHALGLIANSGGFTRQGWEDLIGTMVMLPSDQKTQVSTYLAGEFPRAAASTGRCPSRRGERVDQRVDGADAWFATA